MALTRNSLSANNLTLLRKLQQRKHRKENQLFVAEGLRCISELISGGMTPKFLVFSEGFSEHAYQEYASFSLDKKTFDSISRHESTQGCMAVFESVQETEMPESGKILLLDAIQDPGNLGTIVRSAVWFGIDHIVFGVGCADVFNSKAVSATSGALAHLKWSSAELSSLIDSKKSQFEIFGLALNTQAQTLNSVEIPTDWMLIIGNEGNGIDDGLNGKYTPIFIEGTKKVESLNAAISASVAMFHFLS